MSARSRILVVATASGKADELLREQPDSADTVVVRDWAEALERLGREHIDAIVFDAGEPGLRERTELLLDAQRLLDSLADGVAVVGPDLRILWGNRTLVRWAGDPVQGRNFYEALGTTSIDEADHIAFQKALVGEGSPRRVHARDGRVLDLHITALSFADEQPGRLLALCRDVTEEAQYQQRLDALHRAGRELADLTAEELAEMPPEERIEVLKQNILRFTRDVLHYEFVEVRLLDRRTRRLEPLLIVGMSPEARERRLEASEQNNGVTGFVAATGRSYLCPDTSSDPYYLPGAVGMHSSLTVPLVYQEHVIGTFNVESPQPNGFNDRDMQFLEIFSREIAAALHTFEVLSAEQRETAALAVEAVSREVALPLDDILTAGAAVLDRYIGHDREMADRLRTILSRARFIKQCILKVGEEISPAGPFTRPTEEPPQPFKGVRVLVADNDDRVRRSAHGTLGRWGCVVETARDGAEALTLARLSTYDAILADIRLPDISGYDVYRQLRSTQPQARVVLMTSYGYDPSHSLVKARQDGLNQQHVLYKPFRIDQLRDALAGCAPGGPEQ